MWNSAGVRPEACDTLERIARASDPDARVWKGPGLLTSEQGVRVLGTPLGHTDFVSAHLMEKLEEHEVPSGPQRGRCSCVALEVEPIIC